MAQVEGEILIGRPVGEVFDFVAGSRNEPSFNPVMAGVGLRTPAAGRAGARFRARVGRAATPMLMELTEFGRPRRLGSRAISSVMQTSGALAFAAAGDRTVLSWAWQVRPKGWMRMPGPLSGPLGRRMEARNLDQLEAVPGQHPGPGPSPRPHLSLVTAVPAGRARRKRPAPAARSRPLRPGDRRATGR
jgi:hypothetical protein